MSFLKVVFRRFPSKPPYSAFCFKLPFLNKTLQPNTINLAIKNPSSQQSEMSKMNNLQIYMHNVASEHFHYLRSLTLLVIRAATFGLELLIFYLVRCLFMINKQGDGFHCWLVSSEDCVLLEMRQKFGSGTECWSTSKLIFSFSELPQAF